VDVSGPLIGGGDVFSYEIGRQGRFVVYGADEQTNDVFEAFRRDRKKNLLTRVNLPLVVGGDVVVN
jgi:hypothetical protein